MISCTPVRQVAPGAHLSLKNQPCTIPAVCGAQRIAQAAPRLPRSAKFHRAARLVAAAGGSSPDPFADKYPSWDSIQGQLVRKYDLPSVLPEDAAAMVQAGTAVLLDARLQSAHEESHPEGAVPAPAFRVIEMSQGGGVGRMLKLAIMAVNGVTPTEVSAA